MSACPVTCDRHVRSGGERSSGHADPRSWACAMLAPGRRTPARLAQGACPTAARRRRARLTASRQGSPACFWRGCAVAASRVHSSSPALSYGCDTDDVYLDTGNKSAALFETVAPSFFCGLALLIVSVPFVLLSPGIRRRSWQWSGSRLWSLPRVSFLWLTTQRTTNCSRWRDRWCHRESRRAVPSKPSTLVAGLVCWLD
jgi:hypothetical protein